MRRSITNPERLAKRFYSLGAKWVWVVCPKTGKRTRITKHNLYKYLPPERK